MISNLFPIPVGSYELERNLTLEELSTLKNQEMKGNVGNTSSVNTAVLELEVLKELKKFISSKLEEYFLEIYNPQNDIKLKITQSWTNNTELNQYHHQHAHPNSFISGVFYVQALENEDKIHFYRRDYKPIHIYPKEWNLWNSYSWWLPVSTGKLVLFPSDLIHTVEPVRHAETRISLAFNTYPIGHIGSEEALTGLVLTDARGTF